MSTSDEDRGGYPQPLGRAVRAFFDAYPIPPDVQWLGPREPEVRPVAKNRDEQRTMWMNDFLFDWYADGIIPKVARDHWRGKHILELTTKEEGIREHQQITAYDVRASCAAFYRPGGWLLLWSDEYGTGKTTFANWHLMRYARIVSEEYADQGLTRTDKNHGLLRTPTIVSGTARHFLGKMKAQMTQRVPFEQTAEYKLKYADVLLIEDVPQMSAWEAGLFENMLAQRYERRLRTIITVGGVEGVGKLPDVVGSRVLTFVEERGALVRVGQAGCGSFRRRAAETTVTEIPY